jgi:hypothetical protein
MKQGRSRIAQKCVNDRNRLKAFEQLPQDSLYPQAYPPHSGITVLAISVGVHCTQPWRKLTKWQSKENSKRRKKRKSNLSSR